MTERLYYTDGTVTRFTARVVAVRALEPSRFAVELDATHFYPTSGGQPHDVGTLDDAQVVDVVDEGDQVLHILQTAAAPAVGATVTGQIDAIRRRHHRQQHTGQHVLSRVLEDRLGLPTVSSRLGETGNTIDLPAPSLDPDALEAAEDAANALIWRGLPVNVRFLEPGQVAESGLRKAPAREGTIRMIEVEGVDRSACGGTHVANTAEIGLIAITGQERVRGNTRLHFLCGSRALVWRRSCDRLVGQLATALTTNPSGLAAAVARLQEDARAAARRAQGLARELLAVRLREWAAEAVEVPSAAGKVRVVARELPGAFADLAQEVVGGLVTGPASVAALAWEDAERTHLVVARHAAVPCDCRALLAEALEGTGGKGGGSQERARGSAVGISGAALLERVVRALESAQPPAAG
jgi:alanyl-tRNA synthetase